MTSAQVCGECYTVLAVFREDMTENGEAPVFQEDDQGKQRTGYIVTKYRRDVCGIVY